MASSTCFIPSGTAAIFINTLDGQGDPNDENWTMLPHTISWDLQANVEEPTEVRTSNTGGNKIKTCGGATSWSVAVRSLLADDDWLYSYLLNAPHRTPTDVATLWFYLAWNTSQPIHTAGAAISYTAGLGNSDGVIVKGFAEAPGFGFDNDSSDPQTTEWTIRVQAGPYFPRGATTGAPRSKV